jgi:Chitobiase/beta-hexosaminidase C-terminal domain
MINFVQLQNDVANALLSSDQLANVNVIQYRKLRVQGQVDMATIYSTPRNGRAGCGILVEMPTFTVDKPNLLGPVGNLVFTLAVIEEPNLNMDPVAGTLSDAESTAQLILDELHNLIIAGLVELYADAPAIVPIEDYQLPGTVQYRVQLKMRYNRDQTTRVAMPVITATGDTLAIACATPGVAIYYTLDGTLPTNGAANPGSVLYLGPVTLASGTTLRARAFLAGMTGSNVPMAMAP